MNLDTMDVMAWVLRIAWVLIFFQWLDIILQSFSLRKSIVPAGTDLRSRDSVSSSLASMTGKTLLDRRARSLLDSYSRGWDARGIVDLLSHQSARETYRLCATGLFVLLVLVACVKQSDQPSLAWFGIAALGATLFGKGLVLGRIDSMLEEQIVSKLYDVPAGVAGASADDLAKALAPSIENAFKSNIPQPEKFAAALTAAVEGTKKNLEASASQTATAVAGALDTARKALEATSTQSATALSTSLDGARKALESGSSQTTSTISTSLDAARKAIDASASQLATSLGGGADKLQSAFAAQIQAIEKANASANEQTKAALNSHAEKLGKVSQDLAASLEKIAALGKDIEKVLHVQQTVEGAMKSVSTSEEFKKTLTTLQAHLAASDELVKQASRPRKIRLVEGES